MKKLCCLLLVLATLLSLCACGSAPSPITTEQFTSAMQAKSYQINFPIGFAYLGPGVTGTNASRDGISISFFETGSERIAEDAFLAIMADADSSGLTGFSSSGSADDLRYACFYQSFGDDFFICAYVGNTFMVGYCPPGQMNTVKEIFKSFGYLF